MPASAAEVGQARTTTGGAGRAVARAGRTRRAVGSITATAALATLGLGASGPAHDGGWVPVG